jgi:tripeptidyl-peptidase-1
MLHDSNLPAPDDADQVFLNYLLNKDSVPQTISISYGIRENEVPLAYADAICNLYAQLGARGVTVLVPSGNEGVGKGNCIADEEIGNVQFIPDFPAFCMCIALLLLSLGDAYRVVAGTGFSLHFHGFAGFYVTSVGGTTSQGPEVAAIFSGGGFSNHFPRPIYQNPAVPNFLLQLVNKYDGMYKHVILPRLRPDPFLHRHFDGLSSAVDRGIPDISAQAINYYIVVKGKDKHVSGTSMAVPVRFLSLRSACSIQLITQRIDRGRHNITAKRLLALEG